MFSFRNQVSLAKSNLEAFYNIAELSDIKQINKLILNDKCEIITRKKLKETTKQDAELTSKEDNMSSFGSRIEVDTQLNATRSDKEINNTQPAIIVD